MGVGDVWECSDVMFDSSIQGTGMGLYEQVAEKPALLPWEAVALRSSWRMLPGEGSLECCGEKLRAVSAFLLAFRQSGCRV